MAFVLKYVCYNVACVSFHVSTLLYCLYLFYSRWKRSKSVIPVKYHSAKLIYKQSYGSQNTDANGYVLFTEQLSHLNVLKKKRHLENFIVQHSFGIFLSYCISSSMKN